MMLKHALLLSLMIASAGASAAPFAPPPAGAGMPEAGNFGWIEGNIEYTETTNCLIGNVELLSGAYSGYFGATDASWPRVGDVYYGHAVVAILGNPCAGGAVTSVEVVPPVGTQMVIHPEFPIYCFYTTPPTQENPNPQPIQVTDGSCPQQPQQGQFGYRLNPPSGPTGGWTLRTGSFLEIQFPLISTQPLSGIATGDDAKLWTPIWTIDGVLSPWSFPFQWQFVAPVQVLDRVFSTGFE